MSIDLPFARAEVVKISRGMLSGEVRPLLGARLLFSYVHQLKQEIDAEIWRLIIGVASESDGLPLGPERQLWATDALPEKDKIADDYEQKVRSDLLHVAKELVTQFSKL